MLCNKKDLFTRGECFRKAQVSIPLRYTRNDKQQLINKLKTNKKISKK